jgi:hypothetical protein
MRETCMEGLRGLTKPVEESVNHDVRQNWVFIGTVKEFGYIIAEIYLPPTTLRQWQGKIAWLYWCTRLPTAYHLWRNLIRKVQFGIGIARIAWE